MKVIQRKRVGLASKGRKPVGLDYEKLAEMNVVESTKTEPL